MNIIIHIFLFYIHLIFSLVPYLISGVAVYFYYEYNSWKQENDAINSYAQLFGISREEAVERIYHDPFC